MVFRLPESVRDGVQLLSRLVLGVVMFAYGWDKLMGKGVGAVAAGFEKNGVPLPMVSAVFATVVEFVGGAMLILGVATALVGVLMALDMLGAIVTTGQYQAVLSQNHGFALTGSILAGTLLLATYGAGRWSIDHLLVARAGRGVGRAASVAGSDGRTEGVR